MVESRSVPLQSEREPADRHVPDCAHRMLLVDYVRYETDEARTFTLDVPHALKDKFRGSSGQFVEILIPGDDPINKRNYSLSNTPEIGEQLQFTVKRVHGGAVSNRLINTVTAGSFLQVSPPAGRFVLRNDSRPLILLAAGSGITPIFSLFKAALYTTKRDVLLVTSNRHLRTAIFDNTLRRLVERFQNRVRWIRHFSDVQGYLVSEHLIKYVSEHLGGQAYICGPAPFIDLAENTFAPLEATGALELVFERFISPVFQSNETVIDNANADLPAKFCVKAKLDGREYTFDCPHDSSILEAAIRAGAPSPFSCREGHCGACKAKILSGEVHHERALALSKRDRERGCILPCVSAPVRGPIFIDYDN